MTIHLEEYYVKRSGMTAFLDEVHRSTGSEARSVYVLPGQSGDSLAGLLPDVPVELLKMATASGTGAVLLLGASNHLIIPPFPVRDHVIFAELNTGLLRTLIEKDHLIGLILVHLGTYAVGVCEGEHLVSSKVGTGMVHGRTKKGGSSSARFQRRRQNQAREFLERVCERAREHLQPYERTLEYLQYGGPGLTVQRLKQECLFLQKLPVRELPLMEVPPLRQKVLDAAVTRLWSSRVLAWDNE